MKRAKYLQNMGDIQDALREAGSDGMTMTDIRDKLNLNYAAVQNATMALRLNGYVVYERQGRTIRFYDRGVHESAAS